MAVANDREASLQSLRSHVLDRINELEKWLVEKGDAEPFSVRFAVQQEVERFKRQLFFIERKLEEVVRGR
ncbi:MAG: hypothetical protein H0Z35_13655 [Thermoanaerobacteraceae bacterium]|nr:hypothetical protein [Thermoanaerobacteraceae bacterium]